MDYLKGRKDIITVPVNHTYHVNNPTLSPVVENVHSSMMVEGIERRTNISDDLFSEMFPNPQVDEEELNGKYVSDGITPERLKTDIFSTWTPNLPEPFLHNTYTLPILISAQTGKGKNYFVIHTLRELAKAENKKILYVCNRVALNYQMKKELSNLTGDSLSKNGWDVAECFDNISVISYQKLSSFMEQSSPEELRSYYYVIFDECHYFYSDALFNCSTGETLRKIPVSFKNSFRIYMTATPECVIKPIYSAELSAIMNNEREGIKQLRKKASNANEKYNEIESAFPKCVIKKTGKSFSNLNLLPRIKVYHFPRDFSSYRNISFFSIKTNTASKLKESIASDSLLSEIKAIKNAKGNDGIAFSSDKWIVFVTNKDYGMALKKALEDMGVPAQYFDSDSAKSEDVEERISWAYLLEYGTIKNADFLITTSVLDNGFSIEDKKFKNIVLFTEDKTEFLQQLGRVRLKEGQELHLYIAKMTKNHTLNQRQNAIRKEMLELHYGKDTNKVANKSFEAIKIINEKLGREVPRYVSWGPASNHSDSIKVFMNYMAYYRALLIDEEIANYDRMLEENEETAPVLYKYCWIADEPDTVTFESIDNLIEDIDVPAKKRAATAVERFFSSYVKDKPLNKEQFIDFRKEFKELYFSFSASIRLQSWANSSREEGPRAIQNRFDALYAVLQEFMDCKYTIADTEGGVIIKKELTNKIDSAASMP